MPPPPGLGHTHCARSRQAHHRPALHLGGCLGTVATPPRPPSRPRFRRTPHPTSPCVCRSAAAFVDTNPDTTGINAAALGYGSLGLLLVYGGSSDPLAQDPGSMLDDL
jgi:hypothetical protein